MEKTELTLKVNYIYEYCSYYGYPPQDKRKYIFKDELKRTYVWDTTKCLGREVSPGVWETVGQGDTVKIAGYIKKEPEYKGEPQIELTRCKLVEILDHFPSKEERIALKREKQLRSLTEGDMLYEMLYSQYKAHYADCETLAGSFRESHEAHKTWLITVIVRKGRLKPSGVRGKTFASYELADENDQKICYYAVSEENALRRAEKEFPDHTWECVRIYR